MHRKTYTSYRDFLELLENYKHYQRILTNATIVEVINLIEKMHLDMECRDVERNIAYGYTTPSGDRVLAAMNLIALISKAPKDFLLITEALRSQGFGCIPQETMW